MSKYPDDDVSESLKRIRAAVARGIIDAAGAIRTEAVKSAPVDTGNLRRSAEIYIDGSASKSLHASERMRYVAVRFTAPYSGFVHNAPGKLKGLPRTGRHMGNYWDPSGAEPLFLKKAVERVFPRIETYIKRRVSQENH